jgi:hypothetical protein
VTAAVKPSTEGNVAALLVSVGLHAALLLLPIVGRLHARPPEPTLPNSVAMAGNSIEVEAPTPDFAAAPAAPPPAPEPVDVSALPPEPAHVPEPARVPDPDAAPAPAPPPAKPRSKATAKTKPAAPTSTAEPSTATPPSSMAAAGVETATSGKPAAGTFGQEGLAPGVRRLGYGFARTIPPATQGDAAWRELPVGHVGTIRIELEVDANNHLGAVKRWQARPGEPAPPAVLERLVERTLILMRAGQFALSGSNDPGSERLIIDVEVRDEAANEEGDNHVVQLKFDAATLGQPNKAYFRYGTGRAVEAKVTTVRSGK